MDWIKFERSEQQTGLMGWIGDDHNADIHHDPCQSTERESTESDYCNADTQSQHESNRESHEMSDDNDDNDDDDDHDHSIQ